MSQTLMVAPMYNNAFIGVDLVSYKLGNLQNLEFMKFLDKNYRMNESVNSEPT